MSNEYYTPSGSPTTNSDGSSAVMRAEFASIQTGLDKLPVLAANGDKAVFVNAGGTALTAVTAAVAKANLGLTIGTNVQAYDATLTSIAALGTAANKIAYTTGVDTWSEAPITAAGRALIDDAAASDQRTTLGLGTAATVNTGTSGATIPLLSGANTWSSDQTFAQRIVLAGASTASIEMGRVDGTASAPFIDLHSGATAVDYDVRVQASGGTGSNGGGTLTVTGTLNAVTLQRNGSSVLAQSDIFVSADQTITLAGALTLAHGLGAAPRAVKLALVCQTAELGYSIGDVLMDVSARTIASIVVDATNLNIRYMDSANVAITNKTTGVRAAFTAANWKARFFAIK